MGASLDWSGYKTKVDSLSTDLQGQIKTLLSDKITDGYIKISEVLDLETTATPYAKSTNYYKGEDQLVVNTAEDANYENSYPCTKLKNLKFSDISKDNTECLLKWAGDGDYKNNYTYTIKQTDKTTASYIIEYLPYDKKLAILRLTATGQKIPLDTIENISSSIFVLQIQGAGGGGGWGNWGAKCGAGGGGGGYMHLVINMLHTDLQYLPNKYAINIKLGWGGTGGYDYGTEACHDGTAGTVSYLSIFNKEHDKFESIISVGGGGGGKGSDAGSDKVLGGSGGTVSYSDDIYDIYKYIIYIANSSGGKGGDAGSGKRGLDGDGVEKTQANTLFGHKIETTRHSGGKGSDDTKNNAKGGGGGASACGDGGNGGDGSYGRIGGIGSGGGGGQGEDIGGGCSGGIGGCSQFTVYYLQSN